MKTITLLLLMLFGIQTVQATHLLGGYIQVKTPVSSTSGHEVSVIIYYYISSAASAATSISLCFGDGSTSNVNRQSQQIIPLSNNGFSSGINISTYHINHVYGGPGTYTLTASLSNRTTSINILNNATQQQPLTLSTTFSTVSASNQTPALSIPSTGFEVAINQRVVLPLSATDADGDSLVYSLAKPLTSKTTDLCDHQLISSYQFPNDVTHQGTYKLNNRTGELVWDAPVKPGYYSIALSVGEYRNGILISQTNQEIPIIADDLPGTPSTIPPYEPAIEGTVVTSTTNYADSDIILTTFPNPVDDRLQVIIQTSNPTTAKLQLTDVTGKKLYESGFTKTLRQHEQVINMGSLSPGIYLLRVDVSGRLLLRKIVKR